MILYKFQQDSSQWYRMRPPFCNNDMRPINIDNPSALLRQCDAPKPGGTEGSPHGNQSHAQTLLEHIHEEEDSAKTNDSA